ncbi:MAG TPA: hypothetical protein VFW28_08560 [Micropepsaceae bacterium]|nr:hypothetical protein [Micropepsaceae bacterium]
MRVTGILALLLISGAVGTPAYANFFSNPALGISLNVGSAPNPTPAQIRAFELPIITEENTTPAPATADAKPAQPAPVAQNQTQPASPTPAVSVAAESR